MPWNDRGGPVPDRSEHELLVAVRSRAAQIRRRRVVSASTAAAACLAALFFTVAALASSGDGGGSSLRVTGPGPSQPATTVAATSATTSTVAATSPTSSSPPVSVVGPAPSPTITTTPNVTTPPATTVAPAPTSTTSAPVVACTASEVVVTATPEKLTYASGEAVHATVAAQNRSAHPCVPVDPSYEIRDGAGKSLGGGAIADIFTFPGPGGTQQPWNPGQTLSVAMTWPQTCPPANAGCPPGSYTITAVFGTFRSAATAFTID